MDQTLLTAYEALAARYDANRGQFDMQAVIDDFSQYLPARGRLLDLGCGAGEPVARSFLDRGWAVTGVDFCPAMLALAARYCPEMERIQDDMRSATLAADSFDAATLVYSLFHLPYADHPALFAKIRACLKPGGHLLFTYATRDYSGAERFEGYQTFMDQRLFYSHTTPAELGAQLQAAGLISLDQRTREIGGERFLWVTAQRPAR